MKHAPAATAARILPVVLAVALAGCATTRMNAEWADPKFAGTKLKGQRLLVVCQARDDTTRRLCEDQWAMQLGGQGVTGVPSYSISGFPPGGAANPEEVKAVARKNGATAVLTSQLAVGEYTVVNPSPQVSVGAGGGSGGWSGFGWGGVGVSFPIGGATATQTMSASTSLVEVASGTMMWSGSASTPASGDVTGQVAALTRVTVEALQRAALF